MRLQTFSGSTKKRDRPSDQQSISAEDDGSAPYPPESVRTPSSLAIKVEGAGSPSLIRPPPSSQQSHDNYSKRQTRASNRKQSSSRSNMNDIDPEFISQDTQQQRDGKSNFNNKRDHDPDDLGYRRNRSKTKPNNNKSNGNRKSYASSNHLGKIDDGQIPVVSWIVILSLIGLVFYHVRKAFILEGTSSSKKRGKDRFMAVKQTELHGKKSRRTQQTDNDQDDIHVASLLETETVNKKYVVKPKRTVTKKSPSVSPPNLVEEKLSGGDSPDSASTDGSSSGSAVKNDKDESHTSVRQVPITGKSLENIAPLTLPHEVHDQQPMDGGDWYQPKSRANRKGRKPLGVSNNDDRDTTETATRNVGPLAPSPPSLIDSINGTKDEILIDLVHIAENKISDEKKSLIVNDSANEERDKETVYADSANNSNSSVEEKDSQIDLVSQDPVTPNQKDHEHMPQDQAAESLSKTTIHPSSLTEDADRLLATLLQSQEEASAIHEDSSTNPKEPVWEEVSTKKKKR